MDNIYGYIISYENHRQYHAVGLSQEALDKAKSRVYYGFGENGQDAPKIVDVVTPSVINTPGPIRVRETMKDKYVDVVIRRVDGVFAHGHYELKGGKRKPITMYRSGVSPNGVYKLV